MGLCDVSRRASRPGASDGVLLVRLALDGAGADMPRAADVECWLRDSTSEIEVSLRNASGDAPVRFALAEHLPLGSHLVTRGNSRHCALDVKFHKRSGALSVRI